MTTSKQEAALTQGEPERPKLNLDRHVVKLSIRADGRVDVLTDKSFKLPVGEVIELYAKGTQIVRTPEAKQEPVAFYDRPSDSVKKLSVPLMHGQLLYTHPSPVNTALLEALKRANQLLAELTFSEWIPKKDTPSIDIRQRINAAHVIASSAIAHAEKENEE